MPSVGWLALRRNESAAASKSSTLMPSYAARMPPAEDPHVAVVARVVLVHQPAEPGEVLVVRGLPRLLLAQRRCLFGHRGEAAQDEVGLDRHRLLAPERAVVVEDRNALLDRHRLRAVCPGDACDEVDDSPANRPVAPALELGTHELDDRVASRGASSPCRDERPAAVQSVRRRPSRIVRAIAWDNRTRPRPRRS